MQQLNIRCDLDRGTRRRCGCVSFVFNAVNQIGLPKCGRPGALEHQTVRAVAFDRERVGHGITRGERYNGLRVDHQHITVVAAKIHHLQATEMASYLGQVGCGYEHRQGVYARAACHRAVLCIKNNRVIPSSSINHVRARATIQGVSGGARDQGVVKAVALQHGRFGSTCWGQTENGHIGINHQGRGPVDQFHIAVDGSEVYPIANRCQCV